MNTRDERNKDTIPYLLKKRAAECPNDRVYSFPARNQHYTWSRLWKEVREAAKGFLRLGVQKGDTIAVLASGRIETIISMYAAACAGAIIVPINTYSKKEELEHYLRDACPTVLMIETEASPIPHFANLQTIIRENRQAGLDSSWLPPHVFVLDAASVEGKGFYRYDRLFAENEQIGEAALEAACQATLPDDPLILLYTSGTLGRPKGVLRSTASFLFAAASAQASGKTGAVTAKIADKITKHFTVLNLLPLYHLGGFGTVFAALKGCNIHIVMLSYYHPVHALAAVESEKCRVLIGTPYMIQQMTAAPQRHEYNLKSLLGVAFTSAAVNHTILQKMLKELRLSFFMVSYGSSEAGAVANGTCFIENRKNLLLTVLYRLLKKTKLLSGLLSYKEFEKGTYSIGGKVDEAVEVKIIHPETGEALQLHEQGEIVIRSHRVMRYTKADAEKPCFTEDGWFKSGDLGFLDERRHLTITGRLNRLISRGGEKISPVEIENAILRHKDVSDALVLGVPDELYGEQICACIVARQGSNLTAEKLRKDMEPHLSAFKLPRYYVFLPAFPMSPTGKVSIAELRKLVLNGTEELKRNA
ncbi:acyl--CoA ligase [Paenibacillus sp. N4]|uniref:class I adenylate-forming enzyme family protein n=1 Tax=Paenibacillus vietnamensis TaxID=2590547 RepID=UPI001CD10D81|nr:class I adenylate-forming enzyme family protein [Paenibacillus vietnamensis]MCA0758731.1 acyl--CoA ligase [Paenibacillus vietnamensis]